jgi:hypothetical protein
MHWETQRVFLIPTTCHTPPPFPSPHTQTLSLTPNSHQQQITYEALNADVLHTDTHSHSQAYMLKHAQARAHTHTHCHTHSHKLTHYHTHSHTLTHSHTHCHTHSHTVTLTLRPHCSYSSSQTVTNTAVQHVALSVWVRKGLMLLWMEREGERVKSTDCDHRQYVNWSGQLHTAANLPPIYFS